MSDPLATYQQQRPPKPSQEDIERARAVIRRVAIGGAIYIPHSHMREALKVCTWALATCFHASGADSDGGEDWRIALSAPRAVHDLREDYTEACEEAWPTETEGKV